MAVIIPIPMPYGQLNPETTKVVWEYLQALSGANLVFFWLLFGLAMIGVFFMVRYMVSLNIPDTENAKIENAKILKQKILAVWGICLILTIVIYIVYFAYSSLILADIILIFAVLVLITAVSMLFFSLISLFMVVCIINPIRKIRKPKKSMEILRTKKKYERYR